jgi:hypothetical protein
MIKNKLLYLKLTNLRDKRAKSLKSKVDNQGDFSQRDKRQAKTLIGIIKMKYFGKKVEVTECTNLK